MEGRELGASEARLTHVSHAEFAELENPTLLGHVEIEGQLHGIFEHGTGYSEGDARPRVSVALPKIAPDAFSRAGDETGVGHYRLAGGGIGVKHRASADVEVTRELDSTPLDLSEFVPSSAAAGYEHYLAATGRDAATGTNRATTPKQARQFRDEALAHNKTHYARTGMERLTGKSVGHAETAADIRSDYMFNVVRIFTESGVSVGDFERAKKALKGMGTKDEVAKATRDLTEALLGKATVKLGDKTESRTFKDTVKNYKNLRRALLRSSVGDTLVSRFDEDFTMRVADFYSNSRFDTKQQTLRNHDLSLAAIKGLPEYKAAKGRIDAQYERNIQRIGAALAEQADPENLLGRALNLADLNDAYAGAKALLERDHKRSFGQMIRGAFSRGSGSSGYTEAAAALNKTYEDARRALPEEE